VAETSWVIPSLAQVAVEGLSWCARSVDANIGEAVEKRKPLDMSVGFLGGRGHIDIEDGDVLTIFNDWVTFDLE